MLMDWIECSCWKSLTITSNKFVLQSTTMLWCVTSYGGHYGEATKFY